MVANDEALHAAYLHAAVGDDVAATLEGVLGAETAQLVSPNIRDSLAYNIIDPAALATAAGYFDQAGNIERKLAALKAYEIAGDQALTLGDEFVTLVLTRCVRERSAICDQGLRPTTLIRLVNSGGDLSQLSARVAAARTTSPEAAETFARWAADHPQTAIGLDEAWIQGAAHAPTPALFTQILESARTQPWALPKLSGAQMGYVATHRAADQIIPLLHKFSPVSGRPEAKPEYIWDVLGQRGDVINGERVWDINNPIGAGNIPGYGPLQALNRIGNSAARVPYVILPNGDLGQVGIRGNLIELVYPAGFDQTGTGVAIRKAADAADGIAREVQWRQEFVLVFNSNGTTTLTQRYTVPEWNTGTLDGDSPWFFEADLTTDDSWRTFTSDPSDRVTGNTLLRAYLKANFPTELAMRSAGIPDDIVRWQVSDGPLGTTFEDWVWNHDTPTGIYQLVDRRLHDKGELGGFNHSGGVKSGGELGAGLAAVLPADPGARLQ